MAPGREEGEADPQELHQGSASYPKILIVTEKLLTGFDAPILYAMYLDKPMRDHTLLQAIARVNRPYENEEQELVKPHGFVLDFVGIFDKLEKALAFDSDEINAIVKDLGLLKQLFKTKMEQRTGVSQARRAELQRQGRGQPDRALPRQERRKEFFKEYKEIEMLYEIISPDAFLRPFIEIYATLSAIYDVVRAAYAKTVYVDKAFQRKTNELVQKHVGTTGVEKVHDLFEINEDTIELIKKKEGGATTKVINLIKSIEKTAEEESDDPFLIAMAERAKAVQESFEDRQAATAEVLEELFKLVENNERRKREQAEKGFDGLTYFVYRTMLDAGLNNAEEISKKIKSAFVEHPVGSKAKRS